MIEARNKSLALWILLQIRQACFNLRQHRARSKLSLLNVLLRLFNVHVIDVFLLRRVKVNCHFFNSSKNNQHVGLKRSS